jgi:hypothetical protein
MERANLIWSKGTDYSVKNTSVMEQDKVVLLPGIVAMISRLPRRLTANELASHEHTQEEVQCRDVASCTRYP